MKVYLKQINDVYGAVGAKTKFSYGKMYRQITKIALTFE